MFSKSDACFIIGNIIKIIVYYKCPNLYNYCFLQMSLWGHPCNYNIEIEIT